MGAAEATTPPPPALPTGRRRVIAIGQFPPPVNGLSHITRQMVQLSRETHDVTSVNILAGPGPGGLLRHIRRLCRTLYACSHLIRNAWQRKRICYLACEGNGGLAYTTLVAGTARLFGYTLFLHHHSFSYIDRSMSLMKAVMAAGGSRAIHVFLCTTMRERFEQRYRTTPSSAIVSNAAFVPPVPAPPVPEPAIPEPAGPPGPEDRPLVIGLLSNLNREKGLYLFLDLLRQISALKLNVRGVLAGPVAQNDDMIEVNLALKELSPRLSYRGSLYGDAKTQFYEELDVFVFPTIYANEAQPTVVFEALASGTLVISYDRGCIATQVRQHGLLLARDQAFVPAATAWIADLSRHREGLAQGRHQARTDFVRCHTEALTAARRLFD
jgi:glycosyltransferase involved in cell wall biosynthesis